MDEQKLVSSLRAAFASHDTKAFDAFDFLHAFGSGREALLYARLFWPEFVEFRGMIFLKAAIQTDDDKRRIEETLERYKNDVVETEQSFNVVEIPNLFGRRIGETDHQEDLLLAEVLAETWHCRLGTLFPNRDFDIRVLEPEETGGEIAVIFSQRRKPQKQ